MEGKSKVSMDLCGKHPVQGGSIGTGDWLECKVWADFGDDYLGNYTTEECEWDRGGYKGEFEVGDNVLKKLKLFLGLIDGNT